MATPEWLSQTVGEITGENIDGSIAGGRGVAEHDRREAIWRSARPSAPVSVGPRKPGGPWLPFFDRWLEGTRKVWPILGFVGAGLGFMFGASAADSNGAVWYAIGGGVVGWLAVPALLLAAEVAFRIAMVALLLGLIYTAFQLLN